MTGDPITPERCDPPAVTMLTGDGAAVELPDADAVQQRVARWTADFPDFAALRARHRHPVLALRRFGVLCRQSGDDQRAIEAFTAALSLAPDEVWLWRDLAGAFQGASGFDLATCCARQALRIDPTHAATWLQYAVLAGNLDNDPLAEDAYRRALSLDPDLADAHFGLGLLQMKTLRFAAAVASLRRVAAPGDVDAVVSLSLGHALYMAAQFSESAEAFAQAASVAPLSGHSLQKYARAKTFAAIITGDLAQALADYPALAGVEAEPLRDITRDGFALLSAYGYRAAALAVGKFRLAHDPGDPVQRHLNDAVAGRAIDAVPTDYVEAYFDGFAAGFDERLVGVLAYRVPQNLAALVGRHRPAVARMLDLGCGTGLAGEYLAGFGADLVGVDLSARMLAQAARRGSYRALVKSEAIEFLAAHPASFDLVFAADVLIYFGRLDELIAAVARATSPDGLFAISIERALMADFEILPSGRFAHRESYLMSLTEAGFELVERADTALRLEAGTAVAGVLLVFRRK